VTPEQRADVARLARNLGHDAAFAASGMAISRARRDTRPRRRRR